MKMTIRTKLLLGFLTLMLLLVAGNLIAEYRLDKITRANAKIREEWGEISLVNEAQLSLDESIKTLAEYIISGDEKDKDHLLSSFHTGFQHIKQLEELQSPDAEEIAEEEAHREEELHWIDSFRKDFVEIDSSLDELLAIEDPRSNLRTTPLFNNLSLSSQKVIKDLSRFRRVAQDELNHSIRIARKEENRSDRIMFLSVLCISLGGLGFSFFFSKSITKPIIDLRDRSMQIGRGNFDHHSAAASSNDEIGDLDRSFRTMADNLKDLYENLEELVQERTEELKNANEHMQQLFNGITDGILVIDRDFNLVDVNAGWRKIVGATDEKIVLGSACYASCSGGDSLCDRCPALKTFETGQSSSAEMIWAINGRTLHVEVRTFPLSQNGQKPSMVIEYIKDVSERKKMEEQLFQSNKLAAVGTLAAGIAHEINNPLSSIAYAAEVAANKAELRDPSNTTLEVEVARHLKNIQREVYHCKAITRGLLDFSRESETERELCDMKQVVVSTLELLNFRFKKKNVSARMNFEPAEAYLIGDATRLKQVIFNILSNALDAVAEGGQIEIVVRKSDDVVHVEVADNGIGIPPENLDKAFEPFYTTKPIGQGTGLGLAVCYGIIQNHKGDIRISSRGENRGTVVTIDLPVQMTGVTHGKH